MKYFALNKEIIDDFIDLKNQKVIDGNDERLVP